MLKLCVEVWWAVPSRTSSCSPLRLLEGRIQHCGFQLLQSEHQAFAFCFRVLWVWRRRTCVSVWSNCKMNLALLVSDELPIWTFWTEQSIAKHSKALVQHWLIHIQIIQDHLRTQSDLRKLRCVESSWEIVGWLASWWEVPFWFQTFLRRHDMARPCAHVEDPRPPWWMRMPCHNAGITSCLGVCHRWVI